MVVDRARIGQLEKALEEARAQLWKEEADRLRIILRDIAKEDKNRIMEGLTDKYERILFGLDEPEMLGRASTERPGKSGGELVCDVCGKGGLTKRGLGLHMVRIHKAEKGKDEEEEAPLTRAGRT